MILLTLHFYAKQHDVNHFDSFCFQILAGLIDYIAIYVIIYLVKLS
jgi:hypothetical protein